MRRTIEFTVNGRPASVEAEESDTLLAVLRGQLDLFGTRFGCGSGQCLACAVRVDGAVVAACQTEIGNLVGKAVLTVEGMGTPDHPHVLQTAFLDLQAGQCGYCLAGILVEAGALLERNPDPTRADIASALDGHLCRCGVHNRVMDAVALAAKRLREAVAA